MENICNKIAFSIGKQLNYNDEQVAVVAYGLFAILQTIGMFILSSIIGIIFRCWIECFMIFLAVGIMRKYTGGAHSSTLLGCTLFSLFIIGSLGYISRYALNDLYLSLQESYYHYLIFLFYIPVYTIMILIVKKLAPVDSPNKPIRKPEKIKRLNNYSVILVSFYFLLSALFFSIANHNIRFLSVSLSLLFATVWQTFTLTKPGHKLIHILDFLKPKP
ncbi:MAG: accessory gene regulator B family protein [Eubacteriales bacterium]|nr:accessory gene regulator B family protein [Eubacteriales bacterium]